MIKWPQKETLCPHQNVNPKQLCLACNSHNEAIAACIEAEKNGRMNVGEIYTIIADRMVTSFDPVRIIKMMMDQAKAIHFALYGDTKPDEGEKHELVHPHI